MMNDFKRENSPIKQKSKSPLKAMTHQVPKHVTNEIESKRQNTTNGDTLEDKKAELLDAFKSPVKKFDHHCNKGSSNSQVSINRQNTVPKNLLRNNTSLKSVSFRDRSA